MTDKKRCISNSKYPMYTKLDRVVAWNQHSTNHVTFSKKFIPFMNNFPPQNCTLNLTEGYCKINFISKRKGAVNINISYFCK